MTKSLFLLSQTKPNYDYLQDKLKINSAEELKKRLLMQVKEFDFDMLIKDVEVFLFNPRDSKKIKMFVEFFKQANLE